MSDRSPLRYEAELKVTGQAIYPAEVPAAGLLQAVLVPAAIASGKVLSLDMAEARQTPGFVDVVSHPEADALQASPPPH